MSVHLDIIVVNYHTDDDLDAFLASLDRYPPSCPATLTIVEVDAPEEYTRPFAWLDGGGLTLSVPTNIGYARACNLAASKRSGDILALFNADIEVTPGSLDACVEAFDEHEDWAVIGPRQVDHQGRLRHAGIFGTFDKPVLRGWMERDRGRHDDVRDAVSVSGSAYIVRRSVWDELTDCPLYREIAPDALGAFLPTPHYYEETWCSYHSWAHGHRVIYLGSTAMIHKWHRASPVGGWAEQQFPASREFFRQACRHHGIVHD